MLFYVNHRSLPVEILCVVAEDGTLYLRGLDIARIKGYETPNGQNCFVCGTTTLTIGDVVPGGLRLPRSLSRTRLYTVEQAIEQLNGIVDKEQFMNIFTTDPIAYRRDVFPTFHRREAFTVLIVSESDEHFTEFYNRFKVDVFNYFERIRSQNEIMEVNYTLQDGYGTEYAPRYLRMNVRHDSENIKEILYERIA